jgi:hypothetical protein
MPMMRILISALLALLFTACASTPAPIPPPAEGQWSPKVNLGVDAWWPKQKGEMFVNGNGNGTWMDFQDDFGLDERQTVFTAKAKVDVHPDWFLAADFINYDQNGKGFTYAWNRFNGMNIPAGSDTDTEVTMNILAVDLGWQLYDFRGVSYGVTGGLVASDNTYRVSYVNGATYDSSTEEFFYMFPRLGAYFSYMSRSGLGASLGAKGMWYNMFKQIARYYDLDATVDYNITSNVRLYAGYRHMYYEGALKDPRWKYWMSGPHAGLWIRF